MEDPARSRSPCCPEPDLDRRSLESSDRETSLDPEGASNRARPGREAVSGVPEVAALRRRESGGDDWDSFYANHCSCSLRQIRAVTELSKIKGLRVAAQTSAFSFKDKRATITEIGRTLNVGGEWRWQQGKADLDPALNFAGDKLDLGGNSIAATVHVRF